MPAGLQLSYLLENKVPLTELEINTPKLYHSICGMAYVEKEFGITDEDILNAVRYHTTGRAGMSLLEKVVYIADYISVERDYDDVDVMRELSLNHGLDEAALYALKFSFKSLSRFNNWSTPKKSLH